MLNKLLSISFPNGRKIYRPYAGHNMLAVTETLGDKITC